MKLRDFIIRSSERMNLFIHGRNGMDDLAKFESRLLWVILILMLFLSRIPYVGIVLSVAFWLIFLHMYYRILSRKLNARYRENNWYCSLRYKYIERKNKRASGGNKEARTAAKRQRDVEKWQRRSQRAEARAQRKMYAFFRCPDCDQRVRVPRGRGKIAITCPKCRREFIKRT